jgi:hypothetical protein
VKIALRTKKKPALAYLAPQRRSVPFVFKDGYAETVVPLVQGHQMVVFEV